MFKYEKTVLSTNVVGVFLATFWENFPIYLLLCAIVTFISFGIDKYKAIHGSRRLSEHFLLSLAVLGGAIPAFAAMFVFHHKTSKPTFFIIVTVLAVLQFLLIGALI